MSYWRIVFRSLFFHWKINAAVALGVGAATAVLTGALLVGDSVRGGLKRLTLERLGKIDEIIVADRFFRAELASELSRQPEFKSEYEKVVSVVLFPNAAIEERVFDRDPARAGDVSVTGVQANYWELDTTGVSPNRTPGEDEIIINQTLADALQLSREDLTSEDGVELTVRLPKPSRIPSDNPLGRRDDQTASLVGLTLVDIVADQGLGRFSMRSNQTTPRNAYVNLAALQEKLDQTGDVNALLISGGEPDKPPTESAEAKLAQAFRPNFDDYGFLLKEVSPAGVANADAPGDSPAFHYFSIASERLLLEDATARAAESAFPDGQPVLTYLANEIRNQSNEPIEEGRPYTMISAIEFGDKFPLTNSAGEKISPLADDEIVLNSFMAEQLKASVGDTVRVFYFEPENTHGDQIEIHADFRLAAITPLTNPSEGFDGEKPPVYDSPPLLANDPDLTPTVPGITDAETIDSRDLPFDQTRTTKPIDDEYWSLHRTTPSAYVSLTAGRNLWGSRFGHATSYRVPIADPAGKIRKPAEIKQQLVQALESSGEPVGFQQIAIKRQGLEASSGSTPFDGLFLALSMFIIAAALMLVGLLFRLGVEQRVAEIGILQAAGFRRNRTIWMLVFEGTLVAAVGGLIGIGLGIGYAALMILGLTTIWVDAVATPFLSLDLSNPATLAIGYFSGVIVCALTIAYTVFGLRKVAIRSLLAGRSSAETVSKTTGYSWVSLVVCGGCVVAGFGLIVLATTLGGEAQAMAFMGGGFALLAAGLAFVWMQFRARGKSTNSNQFGMISLVGRNAGANPSRSVLTIGLIAVASFLILAVSSFRLKPTESGTANFDFIGQTSAPVFDNTNSPTGREKVFADEAALLETALPFRFQLGDNASCINLYQSQQPRVLGVSDAAIEHFNSKDVASFEWADSAAETEEEKQNPWRLLQQPTAAGEPIPVVIDKNTAMYSLKLYFGIGEEFTKTYPDQGEVKFKVVGLLSNSILQGSLLIGERDFTNTFRNVSGYQYLLLRAKADSNLGEVEQQLESRLSDQGLDLTRTEPFLASLLAVQNNYIAAFQALGALGLLLGTLGLATVQLRSVLERKGELALMRATGFRKIRLAIIVLLEHLLLLGLGLAVGIFAAALSVAPHVYVGGASAPWGQLGLMLVAIIAVGVAAGYFAVRSVLRAPLLAALRGE